MTPKIVLVAGGTLAAVGTLLTWYGFCLVPDACIAAPGIEDAKGVTVLILAIGAAGCGVVHWLAREPRRRLTSAAAGAGLAAIGLVLAVAALLEQSGLDPGTGLLVSLAGLAAAVVGGLIVTIRVLRGEPGPRDRPAGAAPAATGAPPPDRGGARPP